MNSRNLLLFLCLVLIIGVSGNAHQKPGVYLKGDIGGSFSRKANFQVHGLGGFPDPYNDFSRRIGNAFLGEVGVGYQFRSCLRADLAVSARWKFHYDKIFLNSDRHRSFDIFNAMLMTNLYFEFGRLKNVRLGIFSPYIGAGFGGSLNRTKNYASEIISQSIVNYVSPYTNYAIAWQFIIGSGIELTNHFQLDFGYRYVNLGKIMVGTHSITEPWLTLAILRTGLVAYTHEIYLGTRYNF